MWPPASLAWVLALVGAISHDSRGPRESGDRVLRGTCPPERQPPSSPAGRARSVGVAAPAVCTGAWWRVTSAAARAGHHCRLPCPSSRARYPVLESCHFTIGKDRAVDPCFSARLGAGCYLRAPRAHNPRQLAPEASGETRAATAIRSQCWCQLQCQSFTYIACHPPDSLRGQLSPPLYR